MNNFCDMLRAAIKDEYQAHKDYLDMASVAPSKRSKAMLMKHSQDEYRHYQRDKAIYEMFCRG